MLQTAIGEPRAGDRGSDVNELHLKFSGHHYCQSVNPFGCAMKGSQTDAFATNFLCLNLIAEAILPTTGNHVEIHMP